jgi:DNA-binding transcriptional LysR family regulator
LSKSYEYVIAIEQCGGISQAADFLNIAQPTLSRYLKKLETELGIELFDRSTIPIRATKAGKQYIETGMVILNLEHQLKKQINEIKIDKNTVIRVGISPTRAPYIMPLIVGNYQKQHHEGSIVIEERKSAELNKMLMQGDLDLIISWLDEETKNFSYVNFSEEHILLAVPVTQEYDKLSALDILMKKPLISAGKGQAMWNITQEITKSLGVNMPEIECQSIETALAFVKKGLGATLVPSYISDYSTREKEHEVSFMPLSAKQYPEWENAYKRKICIFYRKEQFLSSAEQNFIACALKVKSFH